MLRPSRPMIRPFMSSDGKLDERDGRLGRMARGDPLEGVGDEVPRAALRLRLRLLLDRPHHRAISWRTSSSVRLEDLALRVGRREARDPLELRELRVLRRLQLLLELASRASRGRRAPARGARAPRPCASTSCLRRGDALLGLDRLRPPVAELALDVGAQLQRLLARLDLRLAADRLGARASRPPSSAAISRSGCRAAAADRARVEPTRRPTASAGDDADQNADHNQHCSLLPSARRNGLSESVRAERRRRLSAVRVRLSPFSVSWLASRAVLRRHVGCRVFRF